MAKTNKRVIEAVYPLSPMQLGMLFHSLYAPESGVYFEQLSCTLRGDLDVPAFERAWQRVVERHAVLRTSFVWKQIDKMLQVVHQRVNLPLEQQDWRTFSPVEQGARLDAFLQADRARGFDLAHAPLIRLALMRTAEDTYRFVWSHHHILLDGWSLPLIMKQVFAFYEPFRQGRDLRLEAVRPYRDYIAWLQRQDMAEAEAFWRRTLAGFSAPTPLVMDQSTKEPSDRFDRRDRYQELEIRLSPEATVALQSLARLHHLTLSTLVQGAWALLLSRYSGEEDVVFGATVSGRPAELAGVETMVGLFINTLPVRVRVRSEASVVDWLKALQAQVVEIRQHEYSPLVQIQEWSDVPRGTPLFESILVFENYPVDASLREQGWSLEIEDVRSIEQTNYPLTVVSGPGQALPLKVSYDCGRFDGDTVQRMLVHLGTLLKGMATDPERRISGLPLLTEAERQQLLVAWNATDMAYPVDRCVHELFELQVARHPQAIAVVLGDDTLTYGELNRRANQLAHYLQKRGVGPETLVGICTERSLEMIVAILGVLKAGGAYLPIDPVYPQARLAFMLEDSQVPVLLTQHHLLDRLPLSILHSSLSILLLDTDWPIIAQESHENPSSPVAPQNLAYVIYTSGSTGRPKGTLLHHCGLCNLVHAIAPVYNFEAGSRVLQFASFSFDASVAEIFPTLLLGATLLLADQDTLASGPDLIRMLQDLAVTAVTLPPSMLAVLPAEGLPALKTVISAGESCSPEIAARWAPGRWFINGYGPTETTVAASMYRVEEVPEGTTTTPIGRPFPNTRLYVLDRRLRPVPVGAPGELYIGGVGVARGYLNRPKLTAERFIPDPFSGESGTRLYRTGDLVRYLASGDIEFLGRVDHQVKVRGFRIELEEIEAVLSKHPAVRQAAVLAREDAASPTDKRLVAYIVPDETAMPGASERLPQVVRRFAREELPAYMVPAAIVVLEGLPLLPNGKVDRRALPAPEGERPELESAYVAPRMPVEEMLAEMWARVLGVERVGIDDDFFDLGGHSLLATRLISRMRQAFQVELPLRELFEAPTVAGLAGRVEAALRTAVELEVPPIERLPRDGREMNLPLSFAQQRLWFLDQLAPDNLFYNVPTAVRLEGRLDIEALERSLNEIVRRHEVLRTTFATAGGNPVQIIAPELRLSLPVEDFCSLPEREREEEALRRAREEVRQPFDLAKGPLLRARLFKLGEEEHVAVVTMHHIVSDGWSMGVLIEELTTLYNAFSRGRPFPLPELPVQYADFSHWQREWLQGEVLEAQLAYWKERLDDRPPMLDLPTDRPRPAIQSWQGAVESFVLPPGLRAKLKALSRAEGATLFMTLLGAFQVLLYRYTGQEDVSVGTAIANRSQREIEGLIGFFVNTLVMRTDLLGEPGFREVLRRVREGALGAYTHQDLPFEMLVEALQPGRDLSHTPLFQVAFALQNAPVAPLELPGLTLTPLEVDSGTAQFDLTLTMREEQKELRGAFEYNTDLFDETTIQRMVAHFQTLLEGIVADPEQPISRLPLLTDAERQQLLVAWNNTKMPYPADRCAHELFEAQAARRPEAAAIIFEGLALTYAELDRQANQLAHYLRKLGVGPEVLVGISTDRSPEMVIGILGTLKAGGAYLPLDPTYPQERLAFMLEDSQVPILLTQHHLLDRLPPSLPSLPSLLLLDADWDTIAREPATKPTSDVTPDNLAYVIYTSGSTGKPKGTLLCHQGLSNLTQAQRRAFGIQEESRVLQFSPFSFDASVWETFMALANGATLCLARQEVLASGPDLVRLIRDDGVTNITLPPSVLRVLSVEDLPELQTVIAAGETCTPDLVARWAPGRHFFNAYGPTETTVCASMYLCDEDDPGAPPIGHPIDNAELYVLDPALQPLPVGVPGELHVGGVSLARGYLNRPELTATKFIPNPFQYEGKQSGSIQYEGKRSGSIQYEGKRSGSIQYEGKRSGSYPTRSGRTTVRPVEPGARLYKTGDLVRYRSDGNIEFLGRIDHQVKVRGFRIELGEIEAVLARHPAVQDSVVVAREDAALLTDRRLVAYVVSQQEHAPGVGELRSFLRQTLPDYMVPSAFVYLEALPLSPSGKVDRQSLPPPQGARPELEREYVAPRNGTEEELAAICAGLLGMDRVGVYDSFFELGGHSLLATQFVSRLRETFHVELPLRTLFEHPTVAGLAEQVEGLQHGERAEIDRIAQLLKQVDQLSEDEVEILLHKTQPV